MARVHWNLNWQEPVGDLAEQAVDRAAEITRGRVRENIQHAGRVETGAMMNTISVSSAGTSPTRPTRVVYSPMPYTIFQETGTSGAGRGIIGAHFFRDALQALSPSDFL